MTPTEFALDPARFHELMAERLRDWPSAMTTTTTHDTKRSEDTRARIAVLAEIPDLWADSLERLLELAPLPDRGFGSLLWQAVLGAWPASRERLHALRREGDARGRRPHHVDGSGRGVRVRGARRGGRGVRLGRGALRARRPDGRDRDGRAQQRAGPEAAGADRPRRARRLSGQRAVGPLAGRPRQPATGRLRPAGAAAGRGSGRRQAAGHRHRAATAPRPARALHVVRRRAGARGGRRPRAGLRPRRRGHRRHPAARRVGRAGWLG